MLLDVVLHPVRPIGKQIGLLLATNGRGGDAARCDLASCQTYR